MTPSAAVRRRALLGSALAALCLTTACSAGGASERAGSHADHAESGHANHAESGREHRHSDEHQHEHEHEHGSVGSALLTSADLPSGYRAGHAHAVEVTGSAQVAPGCAPLARLLRPHLDMHTHPDGDPAGSHGSSAGAMRMSSSDDGHQASAAFSKGHFGPTITERVVDLGGYAAAERAVTEVARSAGTCRRYEHSSSSIGANRYAVRRLAAPGNAPAGHYLRLTAVGADFRGASGGITWDVWVHDCEGMLVAVTFRSALGGDNVDFAPAVDAVMQRLHPA